MRALNAIVLTFCLKGNRIQQMSHRFCAVTARGIMPRFPSPELVTPVCRAAQFKIYDSNPSTTRNARRLGRSGRKTNAP